jgi:hypothetical protein
MPSRPNSINARASASAFACHQRYYSNIPLHLVIESIVEMHRLIAPTFDLPPTGQSLGDGEATPLPGVVSVNQPWKIGAGTD